MGWQGLGGRRERVPGRRPGGGAAAADEVRGSRPEGGWACGPEFAPQQGPAEE